jgi:hypothetical protein
MTAKQPEATMTIKRSTRRRGRGVQTVASQRNPGWFERFRRAVWEVINFPNPPRVHIEP